MSYSRQADKDRIWMNMAIQVSQLATCPRASMGCAIVSREGQILATGYNGAPRGLPHCEDVGCMMVKGHCVRSVHSEINAIVQAARTGTPSLVGSTIYINKRPCVRCTLVIIQVGIQRVVYRYPYDSDAAEQFVLDMFSQAGVSLEKEAA